MSIEEKTFDNLAEVSRIDFDPAERRAYKANIEAAMVFLDKLDEVDTTGMPSRNKGFENQVRNDEVTNEAQIEAMLANAPDRKGSYFRVPRTIEE